MAKPIHARLCAIHDEINSYALAQFIKQKAEIQTNFCFFICVNEMLATQVDIFATQVDILRDVETPSPTLRYILLCKMRGLHPLRDKVAPKLVNINRQIKELVFQNIHSV